MMVGGHLGHGDHKIVEFSILGEVRKGVSKTATLDYQRAGFCQFRRLIDRVPWETLLKGKGLHKNLDIVQDKNLKVAGASNFGVT